MADRGAGPVVLVDRWRSVPVYHYARGDMLATRCGLATDAPSVVMRRDHARLFARPCRRCSRERRPRGTAAQLELGAVA